MRLLSLVLVSVLSALTLAADPPKKPAEAPKAPPPRQLDPTKVPPDLADWTPRPAVGMAEPWEKATDKDWIDARFRAMDTGPFLNCTFRYPDGKQQQFAYKATVIRLGEKGDAGIAFDRNTLRLAAGWVGGYLSHSDRRFGLLNTPAPKGEVAFALPPGPGWAGPDGKWGTTAAQHTAPLPKDWAKYRGLYVHGDRVVLRYTVGDTEVLESPATFTALGKQWIAVDVLVGPTKHQLRRTVLPTAARLGYEGPVTRPNRQCMSARPADGRVAGVGLVRSRPQIGIGASPGGGGEIIFAPSATPQRVRFVPFEVPADDPAAIGRVLDAIPDPDHLTPLTEPGPARWGKPFVTEFVLGNESGPFAVDTLTIPYDNPHKALFFCTGLDFLPHGRIALCTCHGDVWLVDANPITKKVRWQRFATGLYHPLGLKVVGGKVVVLERGQLTRLHDDNGDGEADFYECVNNDWDTGGGEHSYDTCLETDPAGNFYFFKTGDTNTPTGGCLMKVAKDGSKAEVFATGFRHPIGMGMSSTGVLTGADQEGNWMPATRIDQYKQGGFYGDMRAHHREEPPKTFDPPLCWLPREVDNSAGGQVWVPPFTWHALTGLPLHLSYGRCKAFVLLRQDLPDGTVQGGVADLGMHFLSGVCRGRFEPVERHLYVCGLNGWQTAAKADGCLQRVRYTGQPLDVPVKLEVVADGVRLTFSRPLDRAKAADPANYRAAWWNYKWSGEYGSKRWKASGELGQDDVPVTAAEVLDDGRAVLVKVGRVRPVMQMQVGYNVAAADGKKVVGSVYLTVNRVPAGQ